MTFETVVAIVIALCLIGTVIWSFKSEVQIPGPFSWVKGVLVFLMILGACVLMWNFFVGGKFGRVHF